MACGTPVVAVDRGALAEIVRDGETGIVTELDLMHLAARDAHRIGRRQCRAHVLENHSAERMRIEYEQLYRDVARAAVPAPETDRRLGVGAPAFAGD